MSASRYGTAGFKHLATRHSCEENEKLFAHKKLAIPPLHIAYAACFHFTD